MPLEDKIPVIHYDTERIPDDRPGAGKLTANQFWSVREKIVDACRKHGPVGPDDRERGFDYGNFVYWVVEDQYNEERYQYVELCKAAGATVPWLLDLMTTLRRAKYWGVGIGVPEGYLLVLEDRVMVSGPTFRGAHTVAEVLARIRQAEELSSQIKACRSDTDLQVLSRVAGIETKVMELTLPEVTDAGLAFLANISSIVSLSLGQKVTDTGLKWLRGLKKLKTLHVSGAITDRGIEQLRKSTALEELSLANTRITNEGLKHLRELTQLKCLHLSRTAISDRGLAKLEPLRDTLEELHLRATDVTDKGMKHLKRLTQLRRLDLTHTRISDAGLAELRSLPELEDIDLTDTWCTKKGAAKFHASTTIITTPSETYRQNAIQFERQGGWVQLEVPDKGRGQKSTSITIRSEWHGPDLALVRDLAPIRWIYFASEQVTDDLILQLRGTPDVEGIHIKGAALTARGLSILQSLPALDRIFLESMKVSAAMLAELEKVPRLDCLGLEESRLDEAAVEQLGKLKRISVLDLSKVELEKAVIRKLKKQLPKTEIRAT